MTPPTVNAYYNASMNEIVFPAGILQPPFFDAKADDAVNYGGIGAVIGHEMTHGFDDSGSQYDADGNLKNWWTESDRAAYKAHTDLLVKQFDAFEALPGEHVNGKLTLGENIGDLGGLTIAYAALQKALAGKGRPAADRRLHAGAALLPELGAGVAPDHPTARRSACGWPPTRTARAQFRVIGPIGNMPEFASAFSCPADATMVQPAAMRTSIW